MSKSKNEIRADAVAVADDMRKELSQNWLNEGVWVQIVTADPIYYGKLVADTPSHYYLEDACWIANTGRAHRFVEDPSTAEEVEFIGHMAIERPVVALYEIKNGVKLKTK